MKLLFNEHDIGGEAIKDNDTYVVKDNNLATIIDNAVPGIRLSSVHNNR